MSRPGVEIALLEQPPARTPPVDTGVFFAIGPAQMGPTNAPSFIRSMSEFQRIYGARVTYSYLWDAIDCYFKEGGSRAYISRVVGPAPINATVALKDASNAATMNVTANSPGAWANSLSVQITAGSVGGTFVVNIFLSGVLVEVSGDLIDVPAAVSWSQSSEYVVITDITASSLDPAVVAATALVGGTDDNTNIVEDNWTTAYNLFSKGLGPGQVAAPGHTSQGGQTALLAHADANNRVALVDALDSGSKATLKSAAAALQGAVPGNRHAALFAPWAIVPGIVAGTTRIVPWSAIEAGIISRNDAHLSPNTAAAGLQNGQSVYAIGLSQPPFSDSDRQDLNASSVNIVRALFNGIMAYGFRTLVNPGSDPNWIPFSNSRLFMAIVAEADAIAEQYVFDQIDGKGVTFKEFGGNLAGMLASYYNEGSLYGDTPDAAYAVDTGSTVNTPDTISNLEIHAVISVKMSPFGELVHIDIVKKLVTDTI
jgi:hypothetical protein